MPVVVSGLLKSTLLKKTVNISGIIKKKKLSI